MGFIFTYDSLGSKEWETKYICVRTQGTENIYSYTNEYAS